MKTKEFIEKVEELGYHVSSTSTNIFVDGGGAIFMMVAKGKQYKIEIYDISNKENAKELFDLCAEYARTPIEEREEEKKYYLYLKNKNRGFYESIYSYLTLHKKDNTFSLDVGVETAGLTAQFTQKEIDEIKEKFNTDLSEFEQIPVEEIEAE